jgi:tellurite methyltransferase
MSKPEEFWNGIYSNSPYLRGKAPLPFLIEMLPRLRTGKALDIGMGEGANAVYLAQKGFTVKGFDISSTALEHAATLARDTGVAVETKQADLDLFLFGLMEYDTVIMTYFKPTVIRYYSEIIRSLKQGGTLLVESYTNEEVKEILSPDEPWKDFYFKSNELLQGLKGMRILFYNEGTVSGKHLVQCVAQKPLDRDVAKYNLFDMQSGPKESGPTAQQKLAESLFKKKS